MKSNNWIFIVIVMCFVACSGEEENTVVVDMEDIMGETGEEQFEEEIALDTAEAIVEGELNNFVNNQLLDFDTTSHQEFHPLDRFTFADRKKLMFTSKTDVEYGTETMVTPRAELFYYTFSDTTTAKNAFYNWLDCFSDECEMIRLNEDFDAIKMPPEFALIYDTVFVISDYRCEDAAFDWEPFEKELINQFGKGYNYRFEVGCGGPLKWK